MNSRQWLGWFAPLAITGCASAPLTSTLSAAGAASYSGAPVSAMPPAAAEPELDALRAQLGELGGWGSPVSVRIAREPGVVKLMLDAGESFGDGSAELQPAALQAYAGLASALAGRPGVVAHVLVRGELGPVPETSLPARRAASIQSYLESRGVPGTRVRAQGAAAARPAVEVTFRPVIAGREAQAWVPPS